MGRWAQRRRGRGGGGSTALIAITFATFDGLTAVIVGYSGVIDAGDFDTGDFTTQASFLNPESITQNAANELLLEFGVDISTDDELEYNGDVSGVLTPQTVSYS